jgi:N-acetylneuraminic acid mutarotase
MRPSRPAFFFFLLIIFLVLCSSRARKLRTWLGPNNMISGTAPYPRAFITLSSADSKLYIFGGFTNAGDFNDLYQFNTATLEWIDLSGYTTGVTPFARDSHGVTHCAGRLYVFGGFYGPGCHNDFYSLDIATLAWTNLTDSTNTTRPSDRWGHGFTEVGHRLFVYAGLDNSGPTASV